MKQLVIAAALAALAAVCGVASAQEQKGEPAPEEKPAAADAEKQSEPPVEHDEGPARASDEKRPDPGYGTPEEATTAGEGLLWVPRVVLFPVWLVTEYVVRRPLGALATAAEENNLPQILVDFFTFDEEHKTGIVPTALFDFGFQPSIGLYFFADDAFADRNEIRARAATGGKDFYLLDFAERYRLTNSQTLTFYSSYLRRPDARFHGLGPRSRDEDLGRFTTTQSEASVRYNRRARRGSGLITQAGFRDVRFERTGCCDDRSIRFRVNQGRYELPFGFDGYGYAFQRIDYAFDTRPDRPASQTGVRIDVHEESGFDVTSDPGRAWIRYGANAGAYLDVTGTARTLGLVLNVELADPLLGDEVPFFEQTHLGGDHQMPGFLSRRLIGRSAASAELLYTWPVWMYLDGTLHFSMGNVFGPDLEGFDFELLRMSTGLGVRTSVISDHPFQILAAVGTDPLDEGANISSFRLTFGTTLGF